jgi:ZipA, C-terminal FtsZ-binding domain
MSSLQIGLAIAGGIVLVGVVAHNTWTSRKNKPRKAEPYPATASQVAGSPDSLGIEPRFHDPILDDHGAGDTVGDSTMAANAEAVVMHDAALDDTEMARMTPAHAKQIGDGVADLPTPDKGPSLDALIDVIAALEIDSPISGEAALAAYPVTRRVGSKMFALEGLNTETGRWEQPRNGQRYSAFQAGVQLANRNGPLNEIEFSEFVVKTQTFADAINASPEFPDMMEEVARARELDNFASAHDAQLSFTLKATRTAWSPGYVQQNAARLGFVPGVIPGRMVLPAPVVGLPPILGLTFDTQAAMAEDPTQSAIRDVMMSLDVPQVDRGEEPFARLVHIAHELARVMDGVVTDDVGHPLSEAAITAIARDLMALYDTLDGRDLAAGSLQARRLFS